MEVEKESLLKLRKLESQLVSVINKVDREINQVDVEFLNLRSIAMEKIQAAQRQTSVGNEETTKTSSEPVKVPPPLKREYIDNDFKFLGLDLVLNPGGGQGIDEEFDSD